MSLDPDYKKFRASICDLKYSHVQFFGTPKLAAPATGIASRTRFVLISFLFSNHNLIMHPKSLAAKKTIHPLVRSLLPKFTHCAMNFNLGIACA